MTVVPEGTDEMSQKLQQTQSEAGVVDVANAGAATQLLTGPGGGATESQTSMTLQVQGQINIMMNTQLFRAEMATLVAEAVSTPEVRGALSKQGFLNTKSN
jgi:16S rRNA U1498 N3-methylase RsmE